MIDSLESYQAGMESLLKQQLAYYGAIDDEVVAAQKGNSRKDAEIVATVERLLPNTTGFGQAGWFQELKQFLADNATRRSPKNGAVAPRALGQPGQRDVAVAQTIPTFRDAISNWDALSNEYFGASESDAIPPSTVQIAVAYPCLILDKINRVRGGAHTSELGSPLAALNDTCRGADSTPFVTNTAGVATIKDFTRIVTERHDAGTAVKSLPCFGLLEEVNGQYCSTVYTDHDEMGLTVDDIAKILDPRNWPQCCTFFRAVRLQNQPYTGMGWSRILETIGPEPNEFLINTALLFYYGEFDDGRGGIYLNYDIDPSKEGDSGLVKADSGYICVTPLAEGQGVRIRTSKQERVNGLSPTATSALACFFGWGEIGRHMLAGTARAVKKHTFTLDNPQPFVPSSRAFADFLQEQNLTKIDDLPGPATATVLSTLPPNFGDTVQDTRRLASDLVDRVADTWSRAATRWLDGLTAAAVDDISTDVGQQLREFARDVYKTAEGNVKPQLTRPPAVDGKPAAEEE